MSDYWAIIFALTVTLIIILFYLKGLENHLEEIKQLINNTSSTKETLIKNAPNS